MQANEVMLIGTLALFAAFAMGWCMHWLWTQLLRGSLPSIEAMTNVTQELLNATAQRDAAREEAALKEAAELKEGQNCVVVLPDSIRNYLTKHVDNKWLKENNMLVRSE